jgi:hypothetical protein
LTKRFRVYRERRQEIQSDIEAPKGAAALLGRALVRGAFAATKHFAQGSSLPEVLPEDQLADLAGEFSAYLFRKLKSSDDVSLLLRPIEVLTPLLLNALRASNKSMFLVVDTFEDTRTWTDEWLRNIIEGHYGQAPAGLTVCIAGQFELDRNTWAPFESLVRRISLQPFTEVEATELLRRKGVTEKAAVSAILSISVKRQGKLTPLRH